MTGIACRFLVVANAIYTCDEVDTHSCAALTKHKWTALSGWMLMPNEPFDWLGAPSFVMAGMRLPIMAVMKTSDVIEAAC